MSTPIDANLQDPAVWEADTVATLTAVKRAVTLADTTEDDVRAELAGIAGDHAAMLPEDVIVTFLNDNNERAEGGVILTRDQLQCWAGVTLDDDALGRLDDAIPNSSIPEAVAVIVGDALGITGHPDDDEDDAPRALFCEAHDRFYEDECPECPVWTIFGHWENDRLVMDAVVQGEHEDMREQDDETHPEGLWCESASAPSWEEAFALLREHYEATDADEGE